MTTAPELAVVATRLAQTDRRALSQAWYSALHLADGAAPPAPHTARAGAPDALVPRPSVARATSPARAERAPHAPPTKHAPLPRAPRPVPDRRSLPTEGTRRVERAVERAVHTARWRASQTIALDGGRVTLLVRDDAGATRVVALCSEPLRATVERALAHARFVLAARGTAVTAP